MSQKPLSFRELYERVDPPDIPEEEFLKVRARVDARRARSHVRAQAHENPGRFGEKTAFAVGSYDSGSDTQAYQATEDQAEQQPETRAPVRSKRSVKYQPSQFSEDQDDEGIDPSAIIQGTRSRKQTKRYSDKHDDSGREWLKGANNAYTARRKIDQYDRQFDGKTVEELRTWCNRLGQTCRRENGTYMNRTELIHTIYDATH